MGLPEFSVRRPITVLMVTIAVVIFGYLSAQQLPVDLLPDLSYPTLTIQTEYEDAAPGSVEQYVSRPVEEAVGVIPGVREMRSISRPGLSEVILEFGWGEDMDFAALDVREKLGTANLPLMVEAPRVLRYDPSLDPIIRLSLKGERDFDDLRQLVDRWIKPRLESTQGIASVMVRGGLEAEIVIEVNEDRLGTMGLTLDDLSTALNAENINQPGGTLRDQNAIYLVRTLHEFTSLEQVKRTVISRNESRLVRIEDVARVSRGHKDVEEVTRLNGEEVINLDLYRSGSANTIAVAERVHEALQDLEEELGQGLELTVLSDQSVYIAEAVGQVWSAGLLGGLLAVLVLYFFLRDPMATAVISLSIPISAIATFVPLKQAGVSLNIMSLGGLALGIGMLVDNSIVVLEAIDRWRSQGEGKISAAMKGASEVAGAVTASTLTTICVFLPIIFVQGVAGQLFYDQAVTVCLSLSTSLVVSLTLIPALTSYSPGIQRTFSSLLEWDQGSEKDTIPFSFSLANWTLLPVGNGIHWISKLLTVVFFPIRFPLLIIAIILAFVAQLLSRVFDVVFSPATALFSALDSYYPAVLGRALKGRYVVLLVAVGLFAASLMAIPHLGTNLVPNLSQGEFAFQLHLPEGSTIKSSTETVANVESQLVDSGLFSQVFTTIGTLASSASGRATSGENLAQIGLTLAKGSNLSDEAAAIEFARHTLDNFPQIESELVRPSVLAVKAPIAVRLFADDLEELTTSAHAVTQALLEVPGLADLTSTAELGSPEVRIRLDRERAQSLGTTGEQVGLAMRKKISGEVVGQFREGEERLDIRLRSDTPFRDQASKIEALRIKLPTGSLVPISSIADVDMVRGPAAIHRADGSRMAEIAAQLKSADLGEMISAVRTKLDEVSLPPSVKAEMAGQDKELQTSMSSLQLALALAIFLVYAVMAAQFESLLHPMVILISVPLGVTGIVASLLLTGNSVSILVLIGAVMLAGIVVNNAIVFIDAVNRRRREGQELDPALIGAGLERLRPILMTTTTTILALLPMAFGLGAGDELRAPLAITVIGGLGLGTLLTLIVIPCLYRVVSRFDNIDQEGTHAP